MYFSTAGNLDELISLNIIFDGLFGASFAIILNRNTRM